VKKTRKKKENCETKGKDNASLIYLCDSKRRAKGDSRETEKPVVQTENSAK